MPTSHPERDGRSVLVITGAVQGLGRGYTLSGFAATSLTNLPGIGSPYELHLNSMDRIEFRSDDQADDE